MRKPAIFACMVAVIPVAPALALPGPLRLAEANLPKKAPIQRTAQEYVEQIGTQNLFSIAAAKLALQKSKSYEVREFATHLLRSSTTDMGILKVALTASSGHPALPSALDNSHAALLEHLKQAKGSEFDTRFIQQQVDTQDAILDVHQDFAKRGEDVALKRFAAEAEMRIDTTLHLAQKVSHSLGGLQPRA